ncbi:MAG: CHAP domain-containing protein, partial [Patescibacteria group bacterium]
GYVNTLKQFIQGAFEQQKSKLPEAKKSATRYLKVVSSSLEKHFNSFHALHSPIKMGRLDYTFKFSTELIVAGISILIIVTNIFAGAHFTSANNSLTKLLSYHPDQNPALYNKTTTVRTVIAQNNNIIIPSASAQVVLASNDALTNTISANENATASVITENTIRKENPDNIKKLVADQIKVYDTVEGDTLKGIASKFGRSQETIMWANNLSSSTIKPSWNLVILPTNGVLHKITNNDTLPDIAKKYKVDIDKIKAYNGLEDDSDIEPGDFLIVPDGVIITPAKPKPAIKHTLPGNISVYEPQIGGSDAGEHIFPWGQCTWYVALKRKITFGGNAKNWLANARAAGYSTGNVPTVGSIVVTTENRRYGHVAYVEKVDEAEGTITVSESNYIRLGFIDTRKIDMDSSVIRGYIY